MLTPKLWFKDGRVAPINTPQMSWGLWRTGHRTTTEAVNLTRSTYFHCVSYGPLLVGCAHTSKWQGSFRLKRNKKQRTIKSRREKGTCSEQHSHEHTYTPWCEDREESSGHKERGRAREKGRGGGERERDIDFLLFEVPVHHSEKHTLSIRRL